MVYDTLIDHLNIFLAENISKFGLIKNIVLPTLKHLMVPYIIRPKIVLKFITFGKHLEFFSFVVLQPSDQQVDELKSLLTDDWHFMKDGRLFATRCLSRSS